MPYVYILRGAGGRLYTGSTWELLHRLEPLEPAGTDWGLASPAHRRPMELVYLEWYDRIDEAYYREREIHRWRRWQKDQLIADGNGAREAER